MKLWLDDVRPAPEGWTWAKTCEEGRKLYCNNVIEEYSLDHDLGGTVTCDECGEDATFSAKRGYWECGNFNCNNAGSITNALLVMGQGEETGYDFVNFLIDHWLHDGIAAPKVTIHSWNPVGAANMLARLNRFGFTALVQRYEVPK